MWDMTSRGISFRSYSSGGSRGTVSQMDYSKFWQEMTGTTFSGETRDQMEHSEPYGMTSAVIGQNSMGNAEAIMNHISGSRAHCVAGTIGDRRYRPINLTSGETTQHDDIGQHCYLTRQGILLMSLDGQGGSTPSSGGDSGGSGGSGGGGSAGGSGDSSSQERMVSWRFVQNYFQQQGGQQGGGQSGGNGAGAANGSGQSGQHNGNSGPAAKGAKVILEGRVDGKRIHFYDETTEVGYYDKQSQSWTWQVQQDITSKAQQNITHQAQQTFQSSGGQQHVSKAPQILHDGNTQITGTLNVSQIISALGFNGLSDADFKRDISPARYGLDLVMRSRVAEYTLASDPGRRRHGLVAQWQRDICPESVVEGVVPQGDGATRPALMLDYGFNIAVLFKAVQDQQATIEGLRAEIAELRGAATASKQRP